MKFSLYLALVCEHGSWANHHNQRVVRLFLYLLHFFMHWAKLRKCSGSISINHQNIFSLSDCHSCFDCSSLSPIFWILYYKQTFDIFLFRGLDSSLCSPIFWSIIDYNDFIIKFLSFEISNTLSNHNRQSFLLIIARDNETKI